MSQLVPSRFRSVLLAGLLATISLTTAACDRSVRAPVSGTAASLNDEQADLLRDALADAPSHGFRAGAFGETGLGGRSTDDKATRAQLLQATLAYARALHGQAIPRREFASAWGMKPAAYDAQAEFRRAAHEGRLEAWVRSLPPPSPTYEAMRVAYAQYGKIRDAGGWGRLPFTTDLRLGAAGPAVGALRGRLAVEDPAAGDAGAGDLFDAALTEAVQRAQLRYGLHVTGVVDADLRAALDLPVETRLAQIRANLERLRWLPRERQPTRIEVNTAAGQVHVYRDGQLALTMLAAAGKPGDETPILVSAVDRIVLNPTWNVPDRIAEEEILPKGPGYLQRLGFVSGGSDGVKLVQQPGPQNALGQVKFLFDNRYSVYLHDTPAKAAFTREQRSVSHGCVRLAQALDLAQLLLAAEPGWSAQRIGEVLAGGETTEVKLSRPVPVILGYFTAYPVPGGTAFRPDVYGWDAEVLRRLDAQGPGAA